MTLAARASSAPASAAVPAQAPQPPGSAQAQAPASSTPTQTTASAASAPTAPQPPRALSPRFLATLKDIDTTSDEMAVSVAAIKKADLTYSMFSHRRVTEVIARMEKQLPMLKARTADLRRDESLGMLLSARTAFSEVQRDVGSVSDILHGVTVRTPMEADQLDKLLVRLDGAAARLDAALKQFDAGALALIEALDK
jgi:hypothetical protein